MKRRSESAKVDAEKRHADLAALAVLAAGLFLHLGFILSSTASLAPDEALFWDWSRHLAWGYAEKPPMIAWLIALTRAVAGNGEVGVRLGPALLATVTVGGAWLLARRMFGPRDALFTVVLLSAVPLAHGGGLLATPDAVLTPGWSLALVSGWAALVAAPGGRRTLLWLGFGTACAVAVLAKYTALLLPFGLLVYLLLRRDRSRRLGPGPWLALGLIVLALLPVLWWNSAHQWCSFVHVAKQGKLDVPRAWSAKLLWRFVGGEALAVSPLAFGLLVASVVRSLRAARRRGGTEAVGADAHLWLSCFSVPILLMYLAVSLRVKALENWPAPAWISAAVGAGPLLAAMWVRTRGRVLVVAAVSLGVGMTLVGMFPTVLYRLDLARPERLDPSARLAGWRDLGREVGRIRGAHPGLPARLAGSSEQLTAELAFYVPGHPEPACLDLGRRSNQYDIWGRLSDLSGRDMVVVTDAGGVAAVSAQFAEVSVLSRHLVTRRGRPIREDVVLLARGYHGASTRAPEMATSPVPGRPLEIADP